MQIFRVTAKHGSTAYTPNISDTRRFIVMICSWIICSSPFNASLNLENLKNLFDRNNDVPPLHLDLLPHPGQ